MCFWKAADPPIWKHHATLHKLYSPIFAAFICLIVSSVWSYPIDIALRGGAAIFLLVAAGITFAICFSALSIAKFHDERTDPLILQVIIILPLLLIATIYEIIRSFISLRGHQHPNIWVYFALFMIPTYISY